MIIKAVLITGMTAAGPMTSSKGIDQRQSMFAMTIWYNTNLSEKRSW